MQQLPLGVQLEVSSRFETFRAGSNLAAVEELCALRTGPRQPVLWIAGPAGAGKTHLLQATCVRLGDHGHPVAYVPLARTMAAGPALLANYERLDAVLLDDVDRVAGNAGWERALFSLHNELQEQGGRLVLSALNLPARVPFGLADLASRFSAASQHVLKPLPEAEQGDALLGRAHALGLELPPETLAFLQRHAPRDFGALCRLLDRLDAASLATQRRLTIPLAKQVLELP